VSNPEDHPRSKWDRRWRDEAAEPLEADPWLRQVAVLLPAGPVLDLACGRGRNALELARRGHPVTAVDFSGEALDQLRFAASAEQLSIDCLQLDLESGALPALTGFNIVLSFFFLHRPLLPWLKQTIAPGGVAILRTFSSAGPFPPGELDARFVLAPGELLSIFAGWNVLFHEEGLEPSRKGGSLAGIVACRPGS